MKQKIFKRVQIEDRDKLNEFQMDYLKNDIWLLNTCYQNEIKN